MLYLHTCIWLVLITLSEAVPEQCDIIPADGCTCWQNRGKTVTCHGVGIEELPQISSDSQIIIIKKLSITGNDFTNYTFDNLPFDHCLLQTVHLNGNKISYLETSTFSSNEDSISWLDLSDNMLTAVPMAIDNLISLRVLNLEDNKITAIHGERFENLGALEVLKFANNDFTHFTFIALGDFSSLRYISISYADYHYIYSYPPYGIPRNMRGQIDTLRINNTWIPSITLRHYFPNIKHLIVENGEMLVGDVEFDINSAEYRKQLVSLFLPHNEIRSIPQDFLYDMNKLEILDLSYNEIKRVYDTSLVNLDSLVEINFEGNTLLTIGTEAFADLPSLRVINLRHNRITELHANMFGQFAMIDRLFIGGNPLTCTCENQWLLQQIQLQAVGADGPFDERELWEDITCDLPDGVHGQTLANLDPLQCP